jgi:hypothetical protein
MCLLETRPDRSARRSSARRARARRAFVREPGVFRRSAGTSGAPRPRRERATR